jgi:hypothetical protein
MLGRMAIPWRSSLTSGRHTTIRSLAEIRHLLEIAMQESTRGASANSGTLCKVVLPSSKLKSDHSSGWHTPVSRSPVTSFSTPACCRRSKRLAAKSIFR